jgi:hypothetical protein
VPVQEFSGSPLDGTKISQALRHLGRPRASKTHGTAAAPKSYGVFKERTLLDVLAQAEIAYAGWTEEMLDNYRMSHGLFVASAY